MMSRLKMAFSEEDKTVITFLRRTKNYSAKRFIKEFPEKNWKLGGLNALLRKIDSTGSAKRKTGSGRPRTARRNENMERVEELVLSQEDRPQSHLSQRKIARELGISQATVNNIVKKDLRFKCVKKRKATDLTVSNIQARLKRCRKLLRLYPEHKVKFIWFTDEKLFTVASPMNSQNDRLYIPVGNRKRTIAANRLLRTRSTFSQSVMVSVGVSSLGKTSVHFVEPGAKINGAYYRDVLLRQKLLPDI